MPSRLGFGTGIVMQQGHIDIVYRSLDGHLRSTWRSEEFERFTWELGLIDKSLPRFSVIRIAPRRRTDPWVYVSRGGWEVRRREYRLEFLIVSPYENPAHVEALAMLANLHADARHVLDFGKIVPIGRAWMDGSTCDHLLLSLPYHYGPSLEYCRVSDSLTIRIAWTLPITPEEAAFAGKNGVEALEKTFDDVQIDYLDPVRPSVV